MPESFHLRFSRLSSVGREPVLLIEDNSTKVLKHLVSFISSNLPVTAFSITDCLYSFRSSICFCFAETSSLICAVFLSRYSAIAFCSERGGTTKYCFPKT